MVACVQRIDCDWVRRVAAGAPDIAAAPSSLRHRHQFAAACGDGSIPPVERRSSGTRFEYEGSVEFVPVRSAKALRGFLRGIDTAVPLARAQ